MWNQFLVSLKDIYESYMTFSMVDLAQPSFIALWISILFMPLIGVDRRDRYCSLMYVMYLAGAGVTLIFALPQEYFGGHTNIASQLAGTIIMMIFAASRWWYGAGNADQAKALERRIKAGEQKSG